MRRRPAGPFADTSFLALWSGQLVSQAGSSTVAVALLWQAARMGREAVTWAGLAMTLPPLAAFFLGSFADRLPRVRLMQAVDLGRALVAGAAALPAVRHLLGVADLVLAVAAVGLGGAVFAPAEAALLPSVVAPEERTAAYGWNLVGSQVAALAGLPLGGMLVAVGGVALPLVADALSFALSAASLSLVRPAKDEGADGGRVTGAGGTTPWRTVVALILADRPLAVMLALGAGTNLLFAPMAVGIAVLAHALALGPRAYALLETAWAAGAIAGGAVAARVARRWGERAAVGPVAAAGGTVLLLAAVVGGPAAAAAGLFLGAGANAVSNAVWFAWGQRRIPDGVRATAIGMALSFLGGMVPVGVGLYGLVADRWPPGTALALAGISLALAGTAVAVGQGPVGRLLAPTLEGPASAGACAPEGRGVGG
ncbi:MAG: MFS transporter [Firmicutes bacterium]|nr:MFS transporter [Bacillota bacterium]